MNYTSLAHASLEIKKYKNSLLSSLLLKASQKTYLQELQNRIGAIFSTQRGWLKYTYINSDEHPLTRQTLLDIMHKTQEQTLGFTWITTNALLRDIKIEIQKQSSNSLYKQILRKIELCITDTLKHISHDIVVESNNSPFIVLVKKEETFFSLNTDQTEIQELGGRYIPFQQSYDPLYGKKNRGACAGYTLQWADEIIQNGFVASLPRLDERALKAQNSQFMEHWRHSSLEGLITNFLKSEQYCFSTDFRLVVDKIMAQMKPDHVYNLAVYFFTRTAHSMGIRQIPGSETIEFFDSNLGIVVFDNTVTFKKWLAAHLASYYHLMSLGGLVTLYDLGKQPLDARPSIPKIIDADKISTTIIARRFLSLKTVPAKVAAAKTPFQKTVDKSLLKRFNPTRFFKRSEEQKTADIKSALKPKPNSKY
jgi:hypothetical protein